MFDQCKSYIFLAMIFLFSCKGENKNCITTPTLWGITINYNDTNSDLGAKYIEYYIDRDKQVGICWYGSFETYDSLLFKLDNIDLENYILHKKEYFKQCDSIGYTQYLLKMLIDSHVICKDSIEKVELKILDTIVYLKTDSSYQCLLFNKFDKRLDKYYKQKEKEYEKEVGPNDSFKTISIDTMATIKPAVSSSPK
jgi:hypothetical protein